MSQLPQCMASVWVSTSQPSLKTLFASRNPPTHVSAHAPVTHMPVAFVDGASTHESPQLLQLARVPNGVSQPSPAIPLQLP